MKITELRSLERETDSIRNCLEQGIIPPAASVSCRNRVGPYRRPNFSLLAWEARTAQQMWGDEEAEAKYDIWVNCYLCGKRLRASSRWGVGEQTLECMGNIGGRRRA